MSFRSAENRIETKDFRIPEIHTEITKINIVLYQTGIDSKTKYFGSAETKNGT